MSIGPLEAASSISRIGSNSHSRLGVSALNQPRYRQTHLDRPGSSREGPSTIPENRHISPVADSFISSAQLSLQERNHSRIQDHPRIEAPPAFVEAQVVVVSAVRLSVARGRKSAPIHQEMWIDDFIMKSSAIFQVPYTLTGITPLELLQKLMVTTQLATKEEFSFLDEEYKGVLEGWGLIDKSWIFLSSYQPDAKDKSQRVQPLVFQERELPTLRTLIKKTNGPVGTSVLDGQNFLYSNPKRRGGKKKKPETWIIYICKVTEEYRDVTQDEDAYQEMIDQAAEALGGRKRKDTGRDRRSKRRRSKSNNSTEAEGCKAQEDAISNDDKVLDEILSLDHQSDHMLQEDEETDLPYTHSDNFRVRRRNPGKANAAERRSSDATITDQERGDPTVKQEGNSPPELQTPEGTTTNEKVRADFSPGSVPITRNTSGSSDDLPPPHLLGERDWRAKSKVNAETSAGQGERPGLNPILSVEAPGHVAESRSLGQGAPTELAVQPTQSSDNALDLLRRSSSDLFVSEPSPPVSTENVAISNSMAETRTRVPESEPSRAPSAVQAATSITTGETVPELASSEPSRAPSAGTEPNSIADGETSAGFAQPAPSPLAAADLDPQASETTGKGPCAQENDAIQHPRARDQWPMVPFTMNTRRTRRREGD